MQAKIRKYRNNLYISGLGIIVMGAWSVLKVFLQSYFGPDSVVMVIAQDPERRQYRAVVIVFFTLFMLILMMIAFWVHYHIGIRAIRAGKGRKTKNLYLIWCGILCLLTASGIPFYLRMLRQLEDVDTVIASCLVDLVTIGILVDIIYSSYMIHKLEKLNNSGEVSHAG